MQGLKDWIDTAGPPPTPLPGITWLEGREGDFPSTDKWTDTWYDAAMVIGALTPTYRLATDDWHCSVTIKAGIFRLTYVHSKGPYSSRWKANKNSSDPGP